jgi:hypothetical protein
MVGAQDHQLRELILREEFVFVTNHARDFRKLMGESELHPGLIVIVPNVRPIMQRKLFERALDEASKLRDMINRVVEIDSTEVRVFELPKVELRRPNTQLGRARTVDVDWYSGASSSDSVESTGN